MDLDNLYQIICDRRDNPSARSYTAGLMEKGEDEILKKIGEEAMEVILAAKGQGQQRIIEESADLAYHMLVLLAFKRITPDQVRAELEMRHRPAQ